MKLDPATLLTTAFLTLLLFGLVQAFLARRSPQNRSSRWWVASFLLGAFGFLLIILPNGTAPATVLIGANTLFLSGYGCAHAAARLSAGRTPIWWSLALSVGVWPAICLLFAPGFAARITLCSLLIAAFSFAVAIEFRRGALREERNRRLAAVLCLGHALFYVFRAVFGPTLGLTNAAPHSVISTWGAAIALEIVLFTMALATLVVGISFQRAGIEDRRAANTDFLTGIGNRRAFEAAMTKLLPTASDRYPSILLLLDLDKFKDVNDRFGHEAGDRLLRAFADLVSSRIGPSGQFWRLGGDEFAVLLNSATPVEAEQWMASLRRKIDGSSAMQTPDGQSRVSVSIGSAPIEPDQMLTELVLRADRALYDDKRARQLDGTTHPRSSISRAA